LRIVVAHNYYTEQGGEDIVFELETEMLRKCGHEVETFVRYNRDIKTSHLRTFANAIWSRRVSNDLKQFCMRYKPELVHFHNTSFLLSPASYYKVKSLGIPVVQTVHNYRMACVNSMLYRNTSVCEDCVGKRVPINGVIHKCYNNSVAQSAAIAAMLSVHNVAGTWNNAVDTYIALTNFAKQKLVDVGIAENKIAVKPNFLLHDPGHNVSSGDYFLFVGRLVHEKGIEHLLEAWTLLKGQKLIIAGDGPLHDKYKTTLSADSNIVFLGHRERTDVLDIMKKSRAVVVPSLCYEGCPMVILEAFACGIPVIASRLGGMAELVDDDRTGKLFNPGDAKDLASKMEWFLVNKEKVRKMRIEARQEYESKYTAEINHKLLMNIYNAISIA